MLTTGSILVLLSSVWSSLIHADEQLLLAINGSHTPFLDNFLWNISVPATWIPLYVVLLLCIVRRYGKQSLWIMLAFAVCVGLSDYISSGIIKNIVGRPRPTHTEGIEDLLHIVNNYHGGLYGFVSSHAANTICCTLLFSLVWRDTISSISLGVWTVLVCWSRMYLGAHYPADIIGGLLVGTVLALLGYFCLTKKKGIFVERGSYSRVYDWLPCLTLVITCVVCCLA